MFRIPNHDPAELECTWCSQAAAILVFFIKCIELYYDLGYVGSHSPSPGNHYSSVIPAKEKFLSREDLSLIQYIIRVSFMLDAGT